MFRAFRRSVLLPLCALSALLGAVSIPAFPLLHRGDDPACAPQAVRHDGSSHQVGNRGQAADNDQHCILCHWSQWARAIKGDAHAAAALVESGAAATHYVPQLPAVTRSRSAARAPPLS